MKLIVERWVKEKDPTTGEEIEVIKETKEAEKEEDIKGIANGFSKKKGTVRVTLHKCYHDETPTRACTREEL